MLKLIYYPIFLFGYLFFKATKKTLLYSYASFRKIFVLTHGQSNDNLSKTINAKVGKYNDVKANGIFSYGLDIANENFKNAKCRVATLCDYNALIEYATENSLVGSEDLKLLYQWRENPAEWGNLEPV